MTSYKPKYALGDYVHVISYTTDRKWKTCEYCTEGKITVKDKLFVCPSCLSNKGQWIYLTRKYKVLLHGIIGKITIEAVAPQFVNECHGPLKITYMLDSTGIHSGTVWDQNETFVSIEKAQKECDERNKNGHED
jgi:hypothetical protein